MTTFEKYDYLVSQLNSDTDIAILEFATDVYGLNDETLGNVTFYLFGFDDIDSWIEFNESECE